MRASTITIGLTLASMARSRNSNASSARRRSVMSMAMAPPYATAAGADDGEFSRQPMVLSALVGHDLRFAA